MDQEIIELQTMIHQSGELTILELEPVRQTQPPRQVLNAFAVSYTHLTLPTSDLV